MKSTVRCRPLLGTFVEIGVRGLAQYRARGAIESAFAVIGKIHRLLSFHDPASDLTVLNTAGGKPVELHPLSVRVIRLARAMTTASHHAFNCTVGGAMIRDGLLPAHDGNVPIPFGSATDIEIRGCEARLRNGIAITLDGIAKGFAVDLAISILRRSGARAGWVNAGGDLRVFGKLRIPVHVRGADGSVNPLGMLENGAIASSRSTAAEADGFRGQIVGHDAARPRGNARVWTVLSRNSWRADALTKVAANTAPSLRQQRVSSLGGQWIELPS